MNTHGGQMDRKWTGSGPEVGQKWARSGLDVSICLSVCLSIPNTSLTSLMNPMRGIDKRRALAPCNFYFDKSFKSNLNMLICVQIIMQKSVITLRNV